MKWRCTWCGKPHAEDDPPCDNCGHNKFEKAVVRADEAPLGSAGDAVDADGIDTETGTVDTGTTYVWRCPNCGRDHVKNTPPCSRCGNPDLEKTEQTYDDVERDLETPGWLEVAKPYAPVFVVVGLIVALFATGIVPLSILPGVGDPAPPDAPGEGSETAGIDLEATETEIHERLEAEREGTRTYDDGLAAYAEYVNRAYVASEYDGEAADSVEPSDFGVDCPDGVDGWQLLAPMPIDGYDDEADLADGVVAVLVGNDEVTDTGYQIEGVDLHVVDGSIYITYVTC